MNTTFGKKKESNPAPYPIKNNTIGESLHDSTQFNRSNRFASSKDN